MAVSDCTVSGVLRRHFPVLLAFFVLFLKTCGSNLQNGQYRKGDFIIGGLFPIHLRQTNGKCTELRPGGLVWSETMKLAIEEINNNSSFLPNITIGYDIQDTCSHEQAAIASAAKFSFTNTLMFNERYKSAVNSCISSTLNKTRSPVIAALGGEDSRVSVNIANVLQLTDTVQVSYGATSSELSDRGRFSTFFRTVPSDDFQSQAMVDIVNHYKWTCVALVGTDDVYGRSGLDAFINAAEQKQICIAAKELFPVHDSAAQIKGMVRRLKSMKYVEIIVLYSLPAQAVNVFEECLDQNMTEKTWIASDGWSDSAYIRQKHFMPIIQGTIGIEFREIEYNALENHLRNFSILKSQENCWWDEFFILEFNCSRKGDPIKNIPRCTGNESISKDLFFDKLHNPISPYVRDAVYAVSHALNSFQRCSLSDCKNLNYDSFTPKKMVRALRRTSFLGLTGRFDFDEVQKQARYDIINVQVKNGSFEIVKVGEWDADELRILKDKYIQWNNHKKPLSSCGSQCKKGTHKSPTIQCTWECIPCSGDTFTDAVNSDTCKDCPEGYIHAEDHTMCVEVPPQYIKWEDPWGIGLLMVNCLCIISILLILGLVLKNYKTPIITETGGFLNVLLLIVLLQTFVFNFVLLSKPSDTRCYFLTVFFYLAYTSGVVTFLLKVIFIRHCIGQKKEFNVAASTQNNIATFTEQPQRPMWLFCVLGFFAVLLPVFISTMWIVFGEMHSGKFVISRDIVYLTCKSDLSAKGLFLRLFSVVYLSILTFLTTVFAYKTKKISQLQKFREAKHLAYAMGVFLATLLIFYPGWTLIQGPVLQVFSCSMNMIAGVGIILCSFGPKIHVLLLYPVLNSFLHVHPVRKSVQAAALGAGLTLLTTGKGRSATILEDSSPSHTITSPTTTTSIA